MELEHSFTVPVPVDRAWDVLLDVEKVAPCMPGATLDSVDGEEIRGKVKVKVGPISMTYAGTARFVEKDKDSGVVRLEASGKETRGSGTASATVRSVLEDVGDHTKVVVLTTLNVTGKPAQFGRGVMNEVGGKLLGIFATNLAEMISKAEDGDGPAAPVETAPAASQPSRSIDDLGLSARTVAALHKDGITTVDQVTAKSDEELLALDGVGRASVEEIKAKLAAPPAQPSSPPVSSAPSGTTTPVDSAASPSAVVGSDKVSANGARTGSTATSAPGQATQPAGDDSLNLLKVAGMPVLKRSIPVIAGVTAVLIISWRRKAKRRHK